MTPGSAFAGGTLAEGLAPHARESLERAAALALRLHAETVSPEHWLAALLEDETCAATRAVLHAFADPGSIRVEVLALCEGIMVVGSERTLPFSILALATLQAALESALSRAVERVGPADLFQAAIPRLDSRLLQRLETEAGFEPSPAAPSHPSSPHPSPPENRGSPFRHYSKEGLRALGCAGRLAASFGRESIGPAHILVAALEVDPELSNRTGLGASRARMLASGLDADATELPARALAPDGRLTELLRTLRPGAETLDVLGWLVARGGAELNALLRRQKITTALLERCCGAYADPPESPAGEGQRS